jgi:two-component system cell cycle sensor histidine kinase/response regulator CckA
MPSEELRRSHESLEARVAAKTAELAESRAAAAESAEMFFQLFQFAPDALIAIDENGCIDRTNVRALSLFGYNRSELIGRPVEILIPDRFAARHVGHRVAFMQAPHAKPMGVQLDVFGRRKDGSDFPVDVVLSPASSPYGRLVLAVVRDLTEERQTQALTRAAEERLQTAQRMEALGELAGGVAHDFNNMLTVVNGYSELLLARTGEDHPFRNSLQQIKKAGDRCADLTGQLLAFSRRQVLTPSNLDLGSMVADLNQMMTVLLGEAIAVTVTTDPDLWPVRADQAQIEQVLVNLVVNARDAMPEGGALSIRVRNRVVDTSSGAAAPEITSGEYVTVTVTDTGDGMDEATRARAFEPFFTTKPVGQGSGLGLSTAYGFIKQSGGFIALTSAAGRGTTVEVSLPRADSTPVEVSAPGKRLMPGGHERILLAEDEPVVRTFLRHVLTEAGYELLEAADGAAALTMASTHADAIHLLISDVVMPGMNGSDLADRLRTDRPHARVLLISGHAEQLIVERALQKPGTAYLRKPFTAAELLTGVRQILDAPGAP